MTGTDLMPSGAVETFTGTNGATPNSTNITAPTSNEGTGGGLSIQGNQMRMRSGTTSGNRISTRINRAVLADAEMVFDWVVPADGTVYPAIYIRCGPLVNGDGGFYFGLDRTDMTLGKWVPNYTGTDLATVSYSFSVGDIVRTKVALFGARFRARSWLASASEPTSVWQMDYTATGTYPTSGYWGFTQSSASAGSKDFFIDNVDLHDTITPAQATLAVTGSITPSAAFIKSVRKPFAGSITPSGALIARRVVVRLFSGSITATGALAKSARKVFAGSVATTGLTLKRAQRSFAGAITITATIKRSPKKRLIGSVTPAAALTTTNVGRVFGRPGVVVVSVVKAGWVRARIRRG